jgi:UDP-2,3-diacylglucosamine hydrolase
VDAFLDFLAGPCREARALYLLGDVFDEWLGDDDRRAPHPRVLAALRALNAAGTEVGFAHGNHDFLLGREALSAAGCRLLSQPARIMVHGQPVVLLHGDQLCTRDDDYQSWRRTFTDPGNQQRFLALPFAERERRAGALRHSSAQLTRLKPEEIMDVTPGAVVQMLRAHDARHMVHGHTHRPAIHTLDIDGEPGLRAVLGDWYEDDQVLLWDAGDPRLVRARDL